MKTFLNIALIIGTSLGIVSAFDTIPEGSLNVSIDNNSNKVITEVKEIKIKDNGVERTQLIPIDKIGSKSVNKDGKLVSKKGLIIDFTDKDISIEAFETEFNLKLKEKLAIGYYIFENKSESSDIVLIESILKWDENSNVIKTIRPNWKMENKKY